MTQLNALPADVEYHRAIPQDQVTKGRLRQVLATMRRFATFSELLRVAGAAIMVGAMSVFLMQGWLEGNDLQRYFKLLAQTLLLTAGGFSLSFVLKEHKGARLFFGLSLVSVVANFTILGALIYSVVQFDGLLGHYPDYASWVANDPVKVFATSIGAAAVLVPVTMLAFAVLARRSARWLSGLFLASGALLLLPVRASLASSIVAIAAICISLYLVRTLGKDDETLTTFEGRFAKLILFLAPIVMLIRSSYFYTLDSLAMAVLGATVFLLLRHFVVHKETGPKLRGALDIASWPVVVLTATALTDGLNRGFPASLTLPMF
ncbi:MAG: hypothetical protein HKN70_13400, partial [Gammaproteobacteria bacterium]|nr:hypothetical protein [Gammaproteobacteria bacterium]